MNTFMSKIPWNKYNKKHLGILFLVGVLLVIISMPTSKTSEEEENEIDSVGASGVANEVVNEADYKTQLENQLTEILTQVEGVGAVQVMITLKTSTEQVVEKDINTDENGTEESTVYTDTSNGESPYVIKEEYPKIEGIVIAAEGGDNSVVIQNITEAVKALFEVDTHKIKVMKMKIDS